MARTRRLNDKLRDQQVMPVTDILPLLRRLPASATAAPCAAVGLVMDCVPDMTISPFGCGPDRYVDVRWPSARASAGARQ